MVEDFAVTHLYVKLNKDKTKISPISQGINSVGFKIRGTHMLLRNNSKKKIKRKVKAMPRLILNGSVTIRKAEQMLNSWLGHANHGSSYNFIQSLLRKHSFLYMVGKDKIRINEEELQCNL